jgi:hypothetical protein
VNVTWRRKTLPLINTHNTDSGIEGRVIETPIVSYLTLYRFSANLKDQCFISVHPW